MYIELSKQALCWGSKWMEKMNRQDSKWESQLKKGLLDYFVLLVLADKPAHGYGIAAALRAIDAFEVGEGTLYPLLARLAKHDRHCMVPIGFCHFGRRLRR